MLGRYGLTLLNYCMRGGRMHALLAACMLFHEIPGPEMIGYYIRLLLDWDLSRP
jgi:hypothetical protein